ASVGGALRAPGEKSISHRALMLGAVEEGVTVVRNFLRGEDCLATLAMFRALGVAIDEADDGTVRVHGVGPEGLRAPAHVLDCGNSGTAMRLMAGLLAGQPFQSELTGDRSLRQRPMERVAAPLRLMGAAIETTDGRPPLTIRGGRRLRAIDYSLPVASAQVKSAILLAGLSAAGVTTVRSPGPSRDHTERMLESMGAVLERPAETTVSPHGAATLRGAAIDVPGDLSSAAFFIVAGCLAARDGLLLENVGVNPTRTGLLTYLESIGARFELPTEYRKCVESESRHDDTSHCDY